MGLFASCEFYHVLSFIILISYYIILIKLFAANFTSGYGSPMETPRNEKQSSLQAVPCGLIEHKRLLVDYDTDFVLLNDMSRP